MSNPSKLPQLKVVKSGKNKGGRPRVDQANKTLTTKQLLFCRCLANGMIKVDSYKEAYSTKNMKTQTIYEEGSRLSKNPVVSARVDHLISMKEQALTRSAVSLKSKVLAKLEAFMDSATTADGNKIRAAELLGKSVGLFKEVIEDNRDLSKTPEQLSALLEEKLLALESEYNTGKTIN